MQEALESTVGGHDEAEIVRRILAAGRCWNSQTHHQKPKTKEKLVAALLLCSTTRLYSDAEAAAADDGVARQLPSASREKELG